MQKIVKRRANFFITWYNIFLFNNINVFAFRPFFFFFSCWECQNILLSTIFFRMESAKIYCYPSFFCIESAKISCDRPFFRIERAKISCYLSFSSFSYAEIWLFNGFDKCFTKVPLSFAVFPLVSVLSFTKILCNLYVFIISFMYIFLS